MINCTNEKNTFLKYYRDIELLNAHALMLPYKTPLFQSFWSLYAKEEIFMVIESHDT